MQITRIKVTKINKDTDEFTVAKASVIFDNQFAVEDIKIIKSKESEKPLFISMPSKRVIIDEGKKFRYLDYAHPVNQEFRSELETKILDAYKKLAESDKPFINVNFSQNK